MGIAINGFLDVRWPTLADSRSGKRYGSTVVPYDTVAQAVDAETGVPVSRRAEGLVCFVRNPDDATKIDWYQFQGGITDEHLVKIEFGGGGGATSLASVLAVGNETGERDLLLTPGDRVVVGSNRAGSGRGSFNTERGGDNGVSIFCAAGYELNYQAGYLRQILEGTPEVSEPIRLESNIIVEGPEGGSYTELGDAGLNASNRVEGESDTSTFYTNARIENLNADTFQFNLKNTGSGGTGIALNDDFSEVATDNHLIQKKYVDTAIAAALPYRIYTALITQSGTNAPVATVLHNTLGFTPSYSYIAAGTYRINLPGSFGSFMCPIGKTICRISPERIGDLSSPVFASIFTRNSSSPDGVNTTAFAFGVEVGGSPGDSVIGQTLGFGPIPTTIEIRVYN